MKANDSKRNVKLVFVGGGSQMWAPTLIRDIIFKRGMSRVHMDIVLLDPDLERTEAIKSLFAVKLAEWDVDWVSISVDQNSQSALAGADFVLIAISTGRLEAMSHDLAIPEKYGIYHTVGDTVGPGGWSRSLRNIPVFLDYAKQIKEYAPNAFVLNYTNPMGTLTKVLSDELGNGQVVGLCHALFECYEVFEKLFSLDSEDEIQVNFGGLNHFFWILDLKIRGMEGYELIKNRMNGRSFAKLLEAENLGAVGWSLASWVTGELFEHFGYLPYIGDRHICEFFSCYITDKSVMERLKLQQTDIAFREKVYQEAADRIRLWTLGKKADVPLNKTPSREAAADMIRAITFNEGFKDVVNLVNIGQIVNLPLGAVVETMGYVDSRGFVPFAMGMLPDAIRAVVFPHAETQMLTVKAGLSGNINEALMALVSDPVCAHMTPSDVKKMGMELLEANRQYLPQFFGNENLPSIEDEWSSADEEAVGRDAADRFTQLTSKM